MLFIIKKNMEPINTLHGQNAEFIYVKIYLCTNYLSGHGIDHPPHYSAEIKESTELYFYPSNPCPHGMPQAELYHYLLHLITLPIDETAMYYNA
jgi:hypothetical protein